jgi:hypothetical protein
LADKVGKESNEEKEEMEEMLKLMLSNKPDQFFQKIYKDKTYWNKFGPILKQKLADKSLTLSEKQKDQMLASIWQIEEYMMKR